uniref:YTH domain-containing protein n=1 Tax=Kwoniella bestiolae CBS 10118 TaxID=1296100 RepID=A0A1B9FY37_9TREE|nr:hypothetical protein I302_06670 [Kwoniella bestiolae CBS 10118]OCF23687.1 hypothetical protein I302_06670 [Kwoniella bestiolae CBS 10118]
MASAPVAPIRQPRGPSANSFGAPAPASAQPQQPDNGPPAPDTESLLRRHNTVSTTRHQPSSSISTNPAASSAFHGSRMKSGVNRFRSGSLSSGTSEGGLVRKGSGREVRTEVAVPEGEVEEGSSGMETSNWGKGLSRQSSLPSRRANPTFANRQTEAPPELPKPIMTSMGPPPRPPRRISVATQDPASPPPAQSPIAHAPSHSLSSLAMFNRVTLPAAQMEEEKATAGANVSRTQSLRAQAKHSENGGLGRSTSLKGTGEHHRPLIQALSPPSQKTTPRNPFTPPTPPPVSSTAALPPFQLPLPDSQNLQVDNNNPGADLKRHQSLTQGYGSSNRVRERLERSPAVLTLEQREEIKKRMALTKSNDNEHPPISPIVPSVWSPGIPTGQDDGWHRAASQQLQDAFDAMNLGRKMMGVEGNGGFQQPERKLTLETDVLRHPQPATAGASWRSNDEPSWVTSLVGADHTPLVAPRSAGPGTASWQDRENALRQQSYTPQPQQQFQRGGWQDQNQFMQQANFGFLQQQHMMAMKGMMPQPPYLGAPFSPAYPSPPNTAMMQNQAMSTQDRDVIELARQKGLNPATYNCRPAAARFFVIKSYTEEDVQKSLKHEIWSSTVLGNKRLDNAFRESNETGPIYLFFSVNGSRHFCGVAQMLTPVDETTNSTVWAQDKWKGIFKVKWIFVRDVPSQALRHIRLTNTLEKKPITNSRDTQELPYDAGCEVLQIFLDHQTKSKTSLLQDFAYYERLSANRSLQGQTPVQSPNGPGQPMPPIMMAPMPQMTQMPQMPQMPMQMPPHSAAPPVPPIPARFR